MSVASIIVALAASAIVSVADLSRAVQANETNVPFSVEAMLSHDGWEVYPYFAISDGKDAVMLTRKPPLTPGQFKAGDVVRLHGITVRGERRFACADYTNLEVICHGPAPQPLPANLVDFTGGVHDARLIRLIGTVRDTFRDERSAGFVYLVLSEGNDAAYAAFCDSSARNFAHLIGCEIAITGVCNPDEGGARHHYGRMLIARNADSVEILRKPPWWTPRRLLAVILALTLVLGAVLIWNLILRRQVERRSRELVSEQLARIESELKVSERTRLAVELHDTIAQNLTGAALEINTVEQTVRNDADAALRHLALAAKTLSSCRQELRNCIWDLRSLALEEGDMSAAIRRTLEPYVEDASLTVRFCVPRAIFSDSTAHTLMRIIRELVLNAIRHGQAKSIWIAGSQEAGRLLFSVRDDGCGFDPAATPGVSHGHFGLQGIRERIKKFRGTVDIRSTSGTGTKVTIGFDLPKDDGEKA